MSFKGKLMRSEGYEIIQGVCLLGGICDKVFKGKDI